MSSRDIDAAGVYEASLDARLDWGRSARMMSRKVASKPVSLISSATLAGSKWSHRSDGGLHGEQRDRDGVDAWLRPDHPSMVSTHAPQVMPPIWNVAVTFAPMLGDAEPDALGSSRSGPLSTWVARGEISGIECALSLTRRGEWR